MKFITRFLKNESGQSLAEYGLILALIAVVAIGVIAKFGGQIQEKFKSASDCIEGANIDVAAKCSKT